MVALTFRIYSLPQKANLANNKTGRKKMKQTFKFARYIVVVMMVGLLLGTGLPVATAAKNAPVRMVLPQNFSVLADTVSPAVVHIRVEKTVKGRGPALGPFSVEQFRNFWPPFGPERRPDFKQPGLGSGFIIDRRIHCYEQSCGGWCRYHQGHSQG